MQNVTKQRGKESWDHRLFGMENRNPPLRPQTSEFCIYCSGRKFLFVRKELFIVRIKYMGFFQDL